MFATSRISAVILVSRVNSANPDISRNFSLAIWIFFQISDCGSITARVCVCVCVCLWCSEPNHERAAGNLVYYEQILAEQQQQQQQPCSGDEDANDEPINERPRDTYKASDEFQIYERLCRGEQTHVRGVIPRCWNWLNDSHELTSSWLYYHYYY